MAWFDRCVFGKGTARARAFEMHGGSCCRQSLRHATETATGPVLSWLSNGERGKNTDFVFSRDRDGACIAIRDSSGIGQGRLIDTRLWISHWNRSWDWCRQTAVVVLLRSVYWKENPTKLRPPRSCDENSVYIICSGAFHNVTYVKHLLGLLACKQVTPHHHAHLSDKLKCVISLCLLRFCGVARKINFQSAVCCSCLWLLLSASPPLSPKNLCAWLNIWEHWSIFPPTIFLFLIILL